MLAIIFYLGACISFPGFHNKIPQTSWLKQQKFIFSQKINGGQNSKIKAPSGLVSPKTCLLGLQMATLLPPPHWVFLLCTCDPAVSACLNSSSNKNIRQNRFTPTHMTSCNYNYLLTDLSPKYSHILMESRLQHMKF